MTEIPIIEKVEPVDLRIRFLPSTTGGDAVVEFHFEPHFENAKTPPQLAAVTVANQVVQAFGLDTGQQESTDE